MAKDHFIPATILGQFSRETSGPLRDRRVAVQRPRRQAYVTAARNVGYVNHLYDTHAGVMLDADAIWTAIETRLPEAIAVLTSQTIVTADLWLRVLVPYVTCLFVRGREWSERYGRRFGDHWQEAAGFDPGHNANLSRVAELQRTLALVTCARWVIIHSQAIHPLINSDLGLTGTLDTTTEQHGWLIPLSTTLAVAIFPREQRTVVTWDGTQWRAALEHLRWPEKLIENTNKSISAYAQDFIVGPDLATIEHWIPDLGSASSPNAILDAWPFTGAEKRRNELAWHQLVAATHHSTAPTRRNGPVPGPGVLDDALLEGWCPPPLIAANPGPQRNPLQFSGKTIRMSLRD